MILAWARTFKVLAGNYGLNFGFQTIVNGWWKVVSNQILFLSKHRRWPNVVLMLVHRLRRWPNISPTLAQRLVFAGLGLQFASVRWWQSKEKSGVSFCERGRLTWSDPVWSRVGTASLAGRVLQPDADGLTSLNSGSAALREPGGAICPSVTSPSLRVRLYPLPARSYRKCCPGTAIAHALPLTNLPSRFIHLKMILQVLILSLTWGFNASPAKQDYYSCL